MSTYYIDYDSGADTNNGTSTATPFKHCPGDANATNTAASTTPGAGDTVIFKGGVVYYGLIVFKASGNSGAQVVYDGNSAGTWGTGKAIIDGNDTNDYCFFDGWNKREYVTVKNFILRNTDGDDTNAHAIYLYPGAKVLNFVVQDCEITDTGGDCIQVVGDVQLHVTGCYLHDGEVDGIKGSLGDGTVIENTIFANFDNSVTHGDGVQVYGASTTVTVTIRNCQWYGNTQNIYIDTWTAGTGGNFNVYGNRIWKVGATDYNGIVIDTESAGLSFATINVYNNTVINMDSGSGGIRVVARGSGVTTLNVKNNLFYNSGETLTGTIGTLNRDYNLWTNSTDAGEETHGQYWSSGTGLFKDYANKDWHLESNTTAGTDLGASYNTDPDSVTRTTWSRGAYEYVSSASPSVNKAIREASRRFTPIMGL